ncbi:SAM-dependent methyltransferase [Streptomyces sp. NBC_00201]|uniref:SAM-dependent methyltransferase n=1 Tax=unclassified Streptomyces TaxID=2593676 RepID=UPI0022533178|nr:MULTISPECIES: SAM-dependent methyltransferase [unclassified Streptomyces]MCX5063291.1 SAM-dependent methyltransferase [Streptomyces sp. NBC_00452]MCX5251132.1 SAM-dependent methyltransferase [Streptomyces sp. NBC_00201]MCX5290939.1 SAM-dependent methyltransferase [Streptomyces sp. NBC_00183]
MADSQSTSDQDALSKIDTSVPHSARIWNYWMGGKDNYEVDRIAGDAYREVAPNIETMARGSRHYLIRAVTLVAGELGIRQFLDIGTGLPTYDNTHQVAQRIAPESRIVYVDNDPLVLRHAQALLTSSPEGVTEYIDADLHEPEKIIERAEKVLDFDKPVALMLMGILGHIQDYDEAKSIVRRLQAALPSGSYFVHYDSTDTDASLKDAQQGYDDTGAIPYVLRSPQQLAAYYDGLELLEPGIVSCPLWRPESGTTPEPTDIYGGVAHKP